VSVTGNEDRVRPKTRFFTRERKCLERCQRSPFGGDCLFSTVNEISVDFLQSIVCCQFNAMSLPVIHR